MEIFSSARWGFSLLPSRIATALTALFWLSDSPNSRTQYPYPGPIPSLSRCASLKDTLHLENTTILDAKYIQPQTNISVPGTCFDPISGTRGSTVVESAVCRVYFIVNTTEDSAVHAEAWLPDEWYGRFLATGNGGLGGCIQYPVMNYGAGLHFATVGSDNGHDGESGLPFYHHPEVVNDFAYRAIHVQTVIGKQITEAYYGQQPAKSYFLGCSTGGRQGHQAALKFPEDFDGIVAGAPATDFNHLLGWSSMLGKYVGPRGSKTHIQPELWEEVEKEVLSQCDGLDGFVDGIISEPDECRFEPGVLLCGSDVEAGADAKACATETQVEVLNKIYSPLLDEDGTVLYPRYDPGAEADQNWRANLGGDVFTLATDWYSYVIYNDSEHDFGDFGIKDIKYADSVNPGGISTFNGNMSAFYARGGKFLSYHGRRDALIASGQSKRYYNLVSSTLKISNLDSFYRLFLIPGMDHCEGGPGSSLIGQGWTATNAKNESTHNILLALVDWVESEEGWTPEEIVGTSKGGVERTHCRYPLRSVWDDGKEEFVCVA